MGLSSWILRRRGGTSIRVCPLFHFLDTRLNLAEPMGMERLKEALEANDWEGNDELGDAIDLEAFDDDSDAGSIGFGLDAKDREEMEREMRGMKQAIYGGGDGEDEEEDPSDKDVEDLQAMMLKMQAVRGKLFVRSISK